MRTIAAGAFGHGVDEFLLRPSADASRRIRRDIRREDHAERRFDGAPPGKIVTAAGKCVTPGAMADDRQVAAALDLLEVLLVYPFGIGAAAQHEKQQSAHDLRQWCGVTHGRAVPDF